MANAVWDPVNNGERKISEEDRRIAEQLPASGYYFGDPTEKTYLKPVPRAAINKFGSIPGVSLIFDDGTIAIYDVSNAS